MIHFRICLKHVFSIITAVVLSALLVPVQAGAKDYTTKQVVNFDWKKFGKKVIEDADYQCAEEPQAALKKPEPKPEKPPPAVTKSGPTDFEYDAVLDMGQIRTAVADMKKRLNK